jgi:hypothetical protein
MKEGFRRARPLVAVVLCLAHLTAAGATPPALSVEQQRHLDAGEIVLLDTLPPRASASAQGGTAVAVVCAPPAAVWAVLVDWRNHPAIYPRVTRAEVVHADAARVRVRSTLAIGPLSFDVDLDKFPDAERRRVEWRLPPDHSGGFFSESSGYWQVDEAARGASIVTYAVGTRTLAPGFLTRGSHRESLVSAVESLRKQAKHAAGCVSR